MLLPKFLSRKISPEKSLDFLSQKSVLPALASPMHHYGIFHQKRKKKERTE